MVCLPPTRGCFFSGRLACRGARLHILLALCVLIAIPAGAASTRRLRNEASIAVANLKAIGSVDPAKHLSLAISLPLRNQQALTELLSELSNPASPNYRKYLTPAQFTERFGPTEQDYQTVINYARAHGLKVTMKHPNRVILDVDGRVADIEKMLRVTMRNYRHPTEDRNFYAPDSAPTIDEGLPILDISGLDNYELPKPHLIINSKGTRGNAAIDKKTLKQAAPAAEASGSPNTGTGPDGLYMGNDFRTAYAPGVTLTGSGQTVGLVQFDGYTTSDITYYESHAGLPNVTLTNVLLDGFTGQPTGNGGEVEVSLDIEMVISMAPGVSNILVYEAGPNGNWHDMLNQMTTDNIAKQISCSWYMPNGPADPTADMIFQEMAAQGQTFYAASGDLDAYTGLIPFPGDTPYITEVGGVTLTTNGAGGPWSSETVWNWGYDLGASAYVGSGGGVSTQYSIPSYQQGISMTSNLGSTTMRNTPDVALTANQVYVRADGQDYSVGGTSCASPLWAGFTALINEEAALYGSQTIGFLNPIIYALCSGTGYAAAMHDTTTGNNFTTASPKKYPAVTGYDLCTGWGTPNGNGLINALGVPPAPTITTGSPLPSGAVGAGYSATLAASGGSAPYAWSVSSGSLPPGLSLASSSGVINGTPTASGSSTFVLAVSGTNLGFSTGTFSIIVYPEGTPLITTSSPLPYGVIGTPYTEAFSAVGGATPYSWAAVSGTVPGGLSLDDTGLLSGTPTASGTFGFTVQVSGSDGLSSSWLYSLAVPPPPVVTSALTATGTSGFPFSYQITASNNPTSYGASNLPAGLSINPATGLISGMTTVVGGANVAISASGPYGTGTANLSLTIFQTPPPAITDGLTTLYTFSGTDGYDPLSRPRLLQASDGNFYGTTIWGGANENGNVFMVTASGSLTVLYSFTGGADGSQPQAGLVQANDGNLYGTTALGGSSGDGTIFKITTSGSLTTIHAFSGLDGANTIATLTPGSDGKLYGISSAGGTGGGGVIFSITTGGSFTSLYSMSGNNGEWGVSEMIQASDGNLYGTLQNGGSAGDGAIFKVTTSGSFTRLYSFSGADGSQPQTGLIQAADGNLYGTTGQGNISGAYGTIFKITTSGSLTQVHFFNGGDGSGPQAPLMQGIDGKLYGTTLTGGTNNDGTIFEVTTSGSLTTLNSFNGSNGNDPKTGLTQGSDGNLYTATQDAGSDGAGNVVRISPYLAGYVGSAVNYQIGATNYPASYGATGLPSGLNVNTSTGLITGTPSLAGTFTAAVSAVNTGGTGSGSLEVIILPASPAITSELTATGTYGAGFSYQITANNNPVSYGAVGLPAGLSINPVTGLISGTPVTFGTFNAYISASSASGGSGNAPLAITIAGPSVPVITSASSATGTTGQAFAYEILAANVATSYGASGLPTGLSVNPSTGLISGTPSSAGTTSVILSASNIAGTGTANLTITVDLGVPVITSALNASGTAGLAFSYQIAASGNPTSYSAIGLPTGLAVNDLTGVISGTVSSTGTTDLTIRAGNAVGTGSATLVISMVAPPPVITGTLTATGTTGNAFSYQITASNNPISYAASNLPAGLSVNTSSGLISGIPSSTGTFNSTISASNAAGTGTGTLLISVLAPPALPVITDGLITLYFFSGTDGNNPVPRPGLLQASDGDLYGTTTQGGAHGDGSVFRITLSGSLTRLYSFTGGADGSEPQSGLVQANDGNLYGTTTEGGSHGYGVVFRVTTSGSLTNLHTFQLSDGATVNAGLTLGSDGNLYGITSTGGGGSGVIFKITTSGSFTALYSLTGGNGSWGVSEMLQASDGNLYGTTQNGGGANDGTVFKVTTSGDYTMLYSFSGTDGSQPQTGLIQGSDGNLYGTTSQGNISGAYGTLFKITTSGSLTQLHFFNGSDGSGPQGQLMQGSDGNLYGTTLAGGTNSDGTIFETTTSGSFTVLNSFNGSNGNSAQAGLAQASDGNLYGVTGRAGSNGVGNVFRVTPYLAGYVGSGVNYQINATNYPTGYGASNLPTGLNVNASTGLITGTPSATGTFNARISASTVAGTGSAALEVIVLPAVPVIGGNLNASGFQGAAFTYQITASNNPVSYGALELPTGLYINPGTGVISGTPTVSGSFTANISAVDATGGAGYGTLAIYLGTQSSPVITSTTQATGSAGQGFDYQITATNNPASYGADNLPAALSVNEATGLISGTLATTGTSFVELTASNAYGAGYATLLLVSVLGPPSITSAPTATGTSGEPFTYQITANGDPAIYSAAGLPPGLSIDPLAGLIGGTPSIAGTFAAIIGAANVSGSDTAPLLIMIDASFLGWQNEWFTPAQLGDPSVSGDSADPAGDGIPNLMKYALNLDPWTNGADGLPVCGVVRIGGLNYVTLTYTELIFGNDLDYIPEVSVDLQNWNSGPSYIAPVSTTPNPDGVTETVIVRDLAPAGALPVFMNLKVTGP